MEAKEVHIKSTCNLLRRLGQVDLSAKKWLIDSPTKDVVYFIQERQSFPVVTDIHHMNYSS